MTPQDKKVKKTQNKIKKLQSQITDCQILILEEQKVCNHPDSQMTAKTGANTGGYDGPDYDLYWVDAECGACGKRFSADSKKNRAEYLRLCGFTKKGW